MKKLGATLAVSMVMGVLFLGACNGFKLFHSTDDKAITTDIQAKLFNDPTLKTRDIHVESRNGVVTVSGTVSTDLERAAVERMASQEEGVRNVVNTLSVGSDAAAPTPQGVATAESAAPPPAATTPAAPPEPPAADKARRSHHAQTPRTRDRASAQLEAYTNSVTPEAAANPGPTPVSASPAPAPQVAPVAPASAPPPPVAPPAPKPQEHFSIPAGTVITVRMIDSIDSSRNRPGEEFAASLDSPIVLGDRVVASRGADARVRLINAESAGHMTGRSELQLALIGVSIKGVNYPVKTGYYEQHGGSRGRRTAETVGGGAVLGALVGGLLGHGKGAAIGSAVGAGTGAAVQVSTKGQQVKVPAETKLDFTLQDTLTVTMAASD